MSIRYEISLDGDDDGFICWDTQLGDPPNLLPWPVSHAGVGIYAVGSFTREAHETAYGLHVYRVQTSTELAGVWFFGAGYANPNALTRDDIPALPLTEYSFRVWVRGISSYAGIDFYLRIQQQVAPLTLGETTFQLTGDWQAVEVTCTTSAVTTHIGYALRKVSSAVNVTYEIAGLMMVAGDTLPAAFNAGDASNAADSITPAVTALDWRTGLAEAFDSVAAPGRAQITLRNQDQRFSPEVSGGHLAAGRLIRIRSDDGMTRRVHFTGFIERVEPLPGDFSPRSAVIHAASADRAFAGQRVRLPPQVSQRADTIINALLDAVPLRRRVLKDVWQLDQSALGRQTILPGVTLTRALQTGQSVFAYVGDTWADGIPLAAALREVTEAERGRFFIDREGQAQFLNRHHLLLNTTVSATFADSMDGLTYAYGADIISRVQVRLLPRRSGAAGSVLWALDNAQMIPAGRSQQIMVRYRDDSGQLTGALSVNMLRAGVDYQANTQPDGSGSNQTGQVDVLLRAVNFSAAVLEVRNRANRAVYLLAGLQVRGLPLIRGEPVTVEQVSHQAQTRYGPDDLTLDLPALDSVEQADQIARYELGRREQPRGIVREITLNASAHRPHLLARTLFDRITITETQTGHSADYFIVAEAHRVDAGGSRHRATWRLESAGSNHFWLLNVDQLGQTTILAY